MSAKSNPSPGWGRSGAATRQDRREGRTLATVDWIGFWAGLGEVAKNAYSLVVGVVGIIATYMAGNRSFWVGARHESFLMKRQAYADLIGTSVAMLDYLQGFSSAFIRASRVGQSPARVQTSSSGRIVEGTKLGRPVRPTLISSPLSRPTIWTRLSRAEGMLMLVEQADEARSAVAALRVALWTARSQSRVPDTLPVEFGNLVLGAARQYDATSAFLPHLESEAATLLKQRRSPRPSVSAPSWSRHRQCRSCSRASDALPRDSPVRLTATWAMSCCLREPCDRLPRISTAAEAVDSRNGGLRVSGKEQRLGGLVLVPVTRTRGRGRECPGRPAGSA